MSEFRELPFSKLRGKCNPSMFKFKDTSELEPSEGIIGQNRAVRAMEFGLKINSKGYNIYMSGVTGTGKTTYARNYVKEIALSKKTPDDWCYVFNFENPNQPMAINLPAGLGKVFRDDMAEFVKMLKIEISKAFDSEDYEMEKSKIIKEYQKKRTELMEQLSEEAERQGFKVRTTNAGIYFLPVVEGKILNETDYNELDERVRQEITERSDAVQFQTIETIRRIKNVEKEACQKVKEWDGRIALFAVGMHINDLMEKYREHKKVIAYLEKVQEDILENLDDFRTEDASDNQQQQQIILPFMRKDMQSAAERYKVNLLVDNSGIKGAPVVIDFNPTFYNLLGKLEYENELGALVTDFTMIKPGLLHQANGGYLILQAKDVLSNFQSWEVLKRALRTKQISIESVREQYGLIAVSTLKPEPIPLDVKVILVGNSMLYHLLYEYDEDFKKLFKIKADFDDEMERSKENVMELAKFISDFCRREKVPHFNRSGVAKVVEYSSRLAEDRRKLSTRFNEIAEILSESCAWAVMEGSGLVGAGHVKKAIAEKAYRSNRYDKKLLELLEEGAIMIDTEGSVVGQVNGLAILDAGDYSFGKPSKITAAAYIGERGIVNIEREVHMSGTTHSKGVLILNGYIGQKYAQEMPLSLSASLCFEQLYSGVEGDSASSAELYAILSILADVPVKQGIAATGSVNQKGEIQPVGGVTRKIEGFFELCRLRGLTGEQGVIIPYSNINNLVLNDEVIDAVKKGKFHIYPVKTIDEGIEILTGVKAGEKGKDGLYPQGSINRLVYEKLKAYAQTVANFGKEKEK